MLRSLPPIGCFLSLLVTLAGCELDGQMVLATRCFDTTTETYVCCDPDTPESYAMCDAGTDAGSDADADASDGNEADAGADDGGPPAAVCPWSCTPTGGGGFDPFPSYVWFEEPGKLPPKPLDGLAWISWVDVEFAEPTCPPCSCFAPTNSIDGCALPAVWDVESTACQDPSSPSVTTFDSPANWDGSCTSANAIEAGLLCGDEPCVKSLVVQPPANRPCIADPAMPPEGQPLPQPTRRKVIEYAAGSFPGTCNSTSNCVAPPPSDYRLCLVARNADAVEPCPAGWTDRREGWRDVSDTRACTPCTCASPEGGSCIIRVRAHSDNACNNEAGSFLLSSEESEKCVDLLVGTSLGSKSAEVVSYQAGSCVPSISEITGESKTERAVTFCCMPDLEMPN